MTAGCTCLHCKPPGWAPNAALREKFGSGEEVLRRLGIDENVLEGERTDARSRDRWGRDQEREDPEGRDPLVVADRLDVAATLSRQLTNLRVCARCHGDGS
jgi:hypothetical protein